jgi:hypothetical protein
MAVNTHGATSARRCCTPPPKPDERGCPACQLVKLAGRSQQEETRRPIFARLLAGGGESTGDDPTRDERAPARPLRADRGCSALDADAGRTARIDGTLKALFRTAFSVGSAINVAP